MRHCLFLPRALKRRKNSALKKIADYEYEVLGGTHVTLATKHLHEKFPGNPNYSGRVTRIYIGLKDEEALWLGAMHNHTGSFRHQLTYRDQVRNSRQGSKLLSCNDEIQC